MTIIRVVGSGIAHAAPLTLVAGMGHAFLCNADWILLASLMVGSLPGAVIGSLLMSRLPEPVIRNLLVRLLVTVGGRVLWVR